MKSQNWHAKILISSFTSNKQTMCPSHMWNERQRGPYLSILNNLGNKYPLPFLWLWHVIPLNKALLLHCLVHRWHEETHWTWNYWCCGQFQGNTANGDLHALLVISIVMKDIEMVQTNIVEVYKVKEDFIEFFLQIIILS